MLKKEKFVWFKKEIISGNTSILIYQVPLNKIENKKDYVVPIVADAEAGFGGNLNAFELMKAMIETGAAGVHFEDQLAAVKKCGHMGGKVLVPTQEAIQKLVAARLAADALGVDRVGLIGFCMGGMYCFKAARSDRFAKISSFYGMIHVPDGWQSATQGDPMEYLYSGYPERVLAIIGALDPYTPPEQVTELFESGVTVCEYPQAVHGFAHDATRPAHRTEDAADAFARTQEWLLAD